MRLGFIAAAAVATAASLAVAGPASAAANRVWVSGHGVDQAGCGAPTAPCRSLQYAHDNAVNAGGEIDILDPAGYGAVTISKAISIVNDGVGTAGVQSSSGPAIQIVAGAADSVYLRGLNVDGVQKSGSRGIYFNSGGALTIVDCVVRHFGFDGIAFTPGSGATKLSVFRTISSDNGSNGVFIAAPTAGAHLSVVLDHLTAEYQTNGVYLNSAGAQADVTVSNSVVSGNSFVGVEVNAGGSALHLNVDLSVINSNDGVGLQIDSDAVVVLSRSVLAMNAQAGVQNNANPNFRSTGDNRIEDNAGGDLAGPLPTAQALR